MGNNKNTKKNNKTIYITFLIIMFVLYGVGYLVGRIAANAQDSGTVKNLFESIKNAYINYFPIAYIIIAVAAFVVVIIMYAKCKNMYKQLKANPDDDDLWDTLEEKLNGPMILSNIISIANTFFFACLIAVSEFGDYGKNSEYEMAVIIADFIIVSLLLFTSMIIPKFVVDIEKKLNPEKEGNVFDFKFHDVWLASCDEAQRIIAYKAAYASFRKTNAACIIMWVISFITMLVLNTGIYPILCICMIWLVNNAAYMIKGAELEKRK